MPRVRVRTLMVAVAVVGVPLAAGAILWRWYSSLSEPERWGWEIAGSFVLVAATLVLLILALIYNLARK